MIAANAEELLPFRPGVDGPWDRDAAAHLLRRAGFGAPPALLAKVLAQQPDAAVAGLLTEAADPPGLRLIGDAALRVGTLDAVQAAWVHRLLHAPRPALEKLALFFHDHFATSAAKVERPRWMAAQIALFRRAGAGRFEDLLHGVARDPAMLVWLDGLSNRRDQPNENFARELFELFSLGVGNYTETDIREAARACAGSGLRGDTVQVVASAQDPGEKTVFGQRGNWTTSDVVRLSAAHPACPPFLAGKLFTFYAGVEPDAALRDQLGKKLRELDRELRPFLDWLWGSRLFLGPRLRRLKVASPAEYVLGAVASLGLTMGAQGLVGHLARAGQDLLRPPSVKGWPQGAAWLDSTTLLARWLAADDLSRAAGGPASLIECIAALFPEGIAPALRQQLLLASGGDVRRLAAGLLQTPEAQYC